MMDDKKIKIENTEVKGYRELDSYESYKMNGNQGTRHLVEANSFKIKIMAMIDGTKKEDKYLYHALKIMFSIGNVEAHSQWLERNFESGAENIWRTWNNIQKSIERNTLEILYTRDKIKGLTLKVNKNNSNDKRKWRLVLELKYKELTLMTDVNYMKMEKYITLENDLEETDFKGATAMLGNKQLNRQQWFSSTLKQSFNLLDKAGSDLVKHRMEEEKEDK